MLKKRHKWFVVMILMTSTSIAMAAGLTKKQVQDYLDSVPETLVLSEKHQVEQKKIDRNRPLSSSLELMGKDSVSYQDLTALAKKNHFKDAEQWANVGDRVMQAYIVSQSAMTLEQMKANYDTAEASINNNPEYSEDKKQAILKGMKKGYLRNVEMVKKVQSDLPAVQAKMTEIDAVFD